MAEGRILYLVRHAKSGWEDVRLSDFNRPLNPRGLRDAPEMGRRLRLRGIRPDLVLCSPARRARQTLDLLGLEARHAAYDDAIYAASVHDLLSIARAVDDAFASAMLIGHNPAMSQLAGLLTGVNIDHLPTCGVVTIDLGPVRWKEAGACPARLVDFDYPKKGGGA